MDKKTRDCEQVNAGQICVTRTFAAACLLVLVSTALEAKTTLKDTVLVHLANQKTQQCDFRNFVKVRPKPVRTVDLINQNKLMFKNAEQYAAYMHANATRFYFGGDSNAGKRAIDLAVAWAQADAHQSVNSPFKSARSARYPTCMVIGSSLNALFLLDNHPHLTEARAQVIWNWIDAVVEKSYITRELPKGGAGYQDKEQRVNNHNGRRATILAYYAVHKNDKRLLKKSNTWIRRSFGTIKEGIIFDTNRGDWALNYTNLGVAALAEHTAFYSIVAKDRNLGSKQRDINDVADFLLRETLRPNEIHRYAAQNIGRGGGAYGGKQKVWWNERYTNGLTHYAWIDTRLLTRQPPLSLPAPR